MPRMKGHYIPARMTLLKKMRWMRKRAQRWAFNSANGKPVIRWHGPTLAMLEYGWRFRARRFCPFVPGFYMRPALHERHLIRQLKTKL